MRSITLASTQLVFALIAPLALAAPPTGEAASGKTEPLTSNAYGFDSRAPNAVGVGVTAPDFTLPTVDETPFTLSKAVSEGSVLLVVYRGGW